MPPITPHLKQLFNTDTSDDDDNESGIYNDSFILENGSVSTPPPPNSEELRLPSLDILKTPKRVDENISKTPKHFARGYSVGDSEFDKFVPGDSSVRSTSDDLFGDLQNILSEDLGKTPDHCAANMGKTPEHFSQTPVRGTLEELISSPVRVASPPPPSFHSPRSHPATPKSLEALKDILDLDNVLNAGVSEEDYQATVVGALRHYLGDHEDSETVIDKLTTPNKQKMPINPEELKKRLNQLIADNEFKVNLFKDREPKASPKAKNIVFKKPTNVPASQKVRAIAAKPAKSHSDSLYQQLRSIEDSQLEYTAKLNNIKVRNEKSKQLDRVLHSAAHSNNTSHSAAHSNNTSHSAAHSGNKAGYKATHKASHSTGTYSRSSSGALKRPQNNLSSPKLSNIVSSPSSNRDIVIQNQYSKMKAKLSLSKPTIIKQDIILSPEVQEIPNSKNKVPKLAQPSHHPSSTTQASVNQSQTRPSSTQAASTSKTSPVKPSKSSSVTEKLTVRQDPNKQIVVVQPTLDGTVSKVVSTVRPKSSYGNGTVLRLNTGAVAPGMKFVLVPVNSLNRTPQILDKINNCNNISLKRSIETPVSLKRSLEAPPDPLVNKKPKPISFLDKDKVSSELEELNPFQFTGNNSIPELIDQANSKRKTLRNQTAFSKMQTFLDDFVQQNNEQVMEILFLKENNEQLTEKYEALQKDCVKKEVEYKKVKEDMRLMQLQNNKMQKDLDKIKTFIISFMRNR